MKRLLCVILSALFLGVLLTGCQVEVPEEKKEDSGGYYFYYVNGDETELQKDPYVPEEETADFMIQDLMLRLNNKELQGEAVNLLPKEVQINYYEKIKKGSVLRIEFNNAYSKMNRAREILVRAGVVKTFLQVPGIEAVRFSVGKNELQDTKGEPVGNMTADTFVEFKGMDKDAYRYDTFTLYFTDKSGSSLVEETRSVYYKRSLPRERVVLEQLAKGPMVKGHYPTIPENAAVVSVDTADRVCYAHFDSVFSDYALEISEQIPVYSVVNSLLAAVEADKVQISIGGEKEGTFGENMPLYHFYEWNADLIAANEDVQES